VLHSVRRSALRTSLRCPLRRLPRRTTSYGYCTQQYTLGHRALVSDCGQTLTRAENAAGDTSVLAHPPAGASGYRWTILSVGFMGQVMVGALIATPAALAPSLKSTYGLSLGQMGLMLGSVQGGAVLSLIAWGSLADRFGERRVIAVGLSGASGALAVAAGASSGGTLTAMLAAAGLCSASVVAASGRAVMGWFKPRDQGMALGIRQTAAMVGAALAAAILPTLAAAYGLPTAFLALAGFTLCAALAAAVWLREPPVLPRVTASRRPNPLRVRRIWKIAVGSGLLGLSQAALLSFVVLFLHLQRGFSLSAAAGVLAGMTLGGAVLRVALGYWSDRVRLRLLPLRQVTVALAAVLCLSAVATRAPAALLVTVLVIAGTLATGWNGLAFTAVAQTACRDRSGLALGFQQTLLQSVSAATPVVFALVISATSWRAAFALLVPFPIIAYACFAGDDVD
jgi:MFS family permease